MALAIAAVSPPDAAVLCVLEYAEVPPDPSGLVRFAAGSMAAPPGVPGIDFRRLRHGRAGLDLGRVVAAARRDGAGSVVAAGTARRRGPRECGRPGRCDRTGAAALCAAALTLRATGRRLVPSGEPVSPPLLEPLCRHGAHRAERLREQRNAELFEEPAVFDHRRRPRPAFGHACAPVLEPRCCRPHLRGQLRVLLLAAFLPALLRRLEVTRQMPTPFRGRCGQKAWVDQRIELRRKVRAYGFRPRVGGIEIGQIGRAHV